MEDYAVLLFLAGLDTVVNALRFLMLHLAQNPRCQEELRANSQIVPEAVEEMLRRYTFTVPVAQRRQGRRLRGMTRRPVSVF